MPPQSECVETVKEMTAEVMCEKNALVGRLNAMHQQIAEEKDPVTKVRRKVEWTVEKERCVESLNKIVASLRRALEEQDIITDGSTATSLRSSATRAASCPHGASSPSYTNKHASYLDRNQADLGTTVAANIDPDFGYEASQEAGAVEPRQRANRSSSEPLRKLAPWPLSAADVLRSLSSEASQLSEQVHTSLRNRARKVSASMLRRVGWGQDLQERQEVWEQRLKNGFGV